MASQTDQRATDFEEVKKILALQPRIKLVQTEGEPPDCYEIEYHVAGLVREADGSIRKASQHLVLITLPFGYPHFPPAVKPLTPVFHPDIDPDAVRISSRWQQDQSLARLIPYIGEMFCGKIYTLEEPFNQEAADWYAEHAAELPFDSLEESTEANAADEFDLGLEDIDLGQLGSPEEPQTELSLELESPQAVHDISDLGIAEPASQAGGFSLELEPKTVAVQEDFDLGLADSPSSEDDGLDLGLEIGEPEEATPPQTDFGPKLKEIRAHVDRKEMTIAARLLAELPALPEAGELRKKVRAAQEQCDDLLQELKVLEDEDNFAEAQKAFEKLKKIAVDTPGLAEIGRRIQQSQSMLTTFALNEEKTEPQTELPGEEKKKKKTAPKEPSSAKPKEEKPAEPSKEKKEVSKAKSRIARAARQEIPVAPFAAAAVAAAVIIAGGLVYTRDTNVLMEAGVSWQEAQGLVKRNDFRGGEEKANIALSKLKTVITPLREKSRLKQEITALFENEEFKQGKAGKRSYKGQDIPLEEAEKREQLDKMIAQAEALQQNNSGEAAGIYEKAAEIAAASPAPLPADAAHCKEQARRLRMQDALSNADKSEHAGDWENAVKLYQQAMKLCGPSEECDSISKKKTKATFNRELDQAKKNFGGAHGQWQELLKKLEETKKLLEENPESGTAEKRQELDRLMVRSQFYQLLSLAGEAYNKDDDATSVSSYRQALALLKDKQTLFEENERGAVGKINRTISLIEISRAWTAAAAAENAKDLPTALRHYRELQNLLNTPGLTKDESLLALEEKAAAKLGSLSSEAGMKRKVDWLNRNFKRIFMAAYPSARVADLSNPGLSLLRKTGGQELYKLTCTERLYQLELIYLYDPLADQWTPYRSDQ